MLKELKLLKTVSRPEFLPANLGSLAMGLAWSIDTNISDLWRTVSLIGLVFAVLTFVSAVGAQLNTLSDRKLDSKEPRKRYLVEALNALGSARLKLILAIEFLLSLPFIALLLVLQPKPVLVFLWAFGHFMAYAYNVSPLRFKCRSWLAMLSLLLVLSILPVSFVYFTFTDVFEPLFLVFLAGEALNVYAVIIPTEIRDYWVDKTNGVETMTVWLGLVKASVLGITFLVLGGVLMSTAFVLVIFNPFPFLLISLTAVFAADAVILRNYRKLHALARQHSITGDASVAEQIVELSSHNPKWINLAQLSIVILALALIVTKFLS